MKYLNGRVTLFHQSLKIVSSAEMSMIDQRGPPDADRTQLVNLLYLTCDDRFELPLSHVIEIFVE